jgi:hypothetical protein
MHEEAEAVLAIPPIQPIVDESAESWPHAYDVYSWILYMYSYCGLPESPTGYWLADSEAGEPSDTGQQLLVQNSWDCWHS